MILTVSEVTPKPGSTVWEGYGTTAEGTKVWFAGDWRAMEGLMLLVEDMGEVEAEVEDWQILSAEIPHSHRCTCPECHPPF